MSDLIDRQAAIIAVSDQESGMLSQWDIGRNSGLNFAIEKIKALPTIQPEPSIPVAWIEGKIEWLNNMDNYFAELTANIIKTMLNEWRKGQTDNVD